MYMSYAYRTERNVCITSYKCVCGAHMRQLLVDYNLNRLPHLQKSNHTLLWATLKDKMQQPPICCLETPWNSTVCGDLLIHRDQGSQFWGDKWSRLWTYSGYYYSGIFLNEGTLLFRAGASHSACWKSGKGTLETAICLQSLGSNSQSQQQQPYLNPTTKGHSHLLMASIS